MTDAPLRFGFRVLGSTASRRRLVDAAAALSAYASCDPRAEVDREGYLSAFWFGPEFGLHLAETGGSTRGYAGPCWAPFVWCDVDNAADPGRALDDARRLASSILGRYAHLDDDDLVIFFSGSKGYHVGLPTYWQPAPSVAFQKVARKFAERLATEAVATIDCGIYDQVRCFRAPNSRHPRTGLHKRRLSMDELMHLTPEAIRRLADEPDPFDLPVIKPETGQAADDWAACVRAVEREAEAKAVRRAETAGTPRLNRQTMAFIRDGATEGDRHRLLFSAAANLAEFGCPAPLAHALLSEAALDAGLSPREVHRQIECGLNRTGTGGAADG